MLSESVRTRILRRQKALEQTGLLGKIFPNLALKGFEDPGSEDPDRLLY
jgi:hypothetical protein